MNKLGLVETLKTMIKSFESKHLTPWLLESLDPLLQLNWRRPLNKCWRQKCKYI